MKSRLLILLAIVAVSATMIYSKCGGGDKPNPPADQTDRLAEILKDLDRESYSLSFDKAIDGAGIKQTSYGAESLLAFADPQDLICPEPFRLKIRRVPIWRIPIRVLPTCPTMIPFEKFNGINEFLAKADPAQFGSMKAIKVDGGGALLATERFTASFANAKLDKYDEALSNLDGAKFLILNAGGGGDTLGMPRDFYGYGDINSAVLKKYKVSLKDILKPQLKGCFDILVLERLKELLGRVNPTTYRDLTVTPLAQDKNIGILTAGKQ